MTILGIESSCDETAAAIVVDGTNLLSNVIASSQQMHAKFGGIIPDRAAREQLKSIIPVIFEALQRASCTVEDLDAIAVTVGPGLIGSLLVGVETAKTLSLVWQKPLVPINHLIGHIYANWLTKAAPALSLQLSLNPPTLPALVLLVSGGHTELILMTDHQKYKIIGSTRDDAAGECLDKCGRLLGLPYPYGPYIQQEAVKHLSSDRQISLPRPLSGSKDYDFSFSGLKTAFLTEVKKYTPEELKNLVPDLSHELQEAVVDVLVKKSLQALLKFQPQSFVLAGGVAANLRLRERLAEEIANKYPLVRLHIPPVALCTDNASYIAGCAFFNYQPLPISQVDATPDLNF